MDFSSIKKDSFSYYSAKSMLEGVNRALKSMLAAYAKQEVTLEYLNDYFYISLKDLDTEYDLFKYPQWAALVEDPSGLRGDWLPFFKKVYTENYTRVQKEHQK